MDLLEHRADRRSPSWLHAVIEPESESSGRGGLVVDLSSGGAGIELNAWNGDNRGTLGLLGGGHRYLIPFVVVGEETTLRGVLLHVKFEEVDPRCKSFLAETLEEAATDFEATQKDLAQRPDS